MLYHFYLILLFFLTWRRMARLRWTMEKWLFNVLSPSGWQLIQQKKKRKKERTPRFMSTVYLYFGLAHPVRGLFGKEGRCDCDRMLSKMKMSQWNTSHCVFYFVLLKGGEEGVFIPKCTEMSEVTQCGHRHAESSQSGTQVFHKHMEVAVE